MLIAADPIATEDLRYFVVAVVAPIAVFVLGGRLAAGARAALVVSALATWLAVSAAMTWLVPDPSHLGSLLFFYLLVMPCLGVPVAALAATRLVRPRGRLGSALLLAALGWLVGLFLVFFLSSLLGAPPHFRDHAFSLALPALYAASGAVVAAGLDARRVV
jgi:hypothetical protein